MSGKRDSNPRPLAWDPAESGATIPIAIGSATAACIANLLIGSQRLHRFFFISQRRLLEGTLRLLVLSPASHLPDCVTCEKYFYRLRIEKPANVFSSM